jgi:hypothetical protein
VSVFAAGFSGDLKMVGPYFLVMCSTFLPIFVVWLLLFLGGVVAYVLAQLFVFPMVKDGHPSRVYWQAGLHVLWIGAVVTTAATNVGYAAPFGLPVGMLRFVT